MKKREMEAVKTAPFLRYPGGKQRHLLDFAHLMPEPGVVPSYVEPFLGGGAVFFHLQPQRAKLSDLNVELIELYKAIRISPVKVWNRYRSFSATKQGFYEIRSWDPTSLDLATRAARTLYLNRTCFKGMWRHNHAGNFNVGFGGEDRRAAAARSDLLAVSRQLKSALIGCRDFEEALDEANEGDFAFLDPPYRPGESQILHETGRERKPRAVVAPEASGRVPPGSREPITR